MLSSLSWCTCKSTMTVEHLERIPKVSHRKIKLFLKWFCRNAEYWMYRLLTEKLNKYLRLLYWRLHNKLNCSPQVWTMTLRLNYQLYQECLIHLHFKNNNICRLVKHFNTNLCFHDKWPQVKQRWKKYVIALKVLSDRKRLLLRLLFNDLNDLYFQ